MSEGRDTFSIEEDEDDDDMGDIDILYWRRRSTFAANRVTSYLYIDIFIFIYKGNMLYIDILEKPI